MAAVSTVLAATAATMSVMNSAQQAGAISAQNDYQNRMTDINVRRTEMQRVDSIQRGETSANKYRSDVKKLVGSQKAAFAAQGIDISSGGASDFMAETEMLGEQDAQRIRTNAFRESLGYGMQQSDYEANRIMNNSSATTNRSATLLGGALNASRYAYEYYGTGQKPTPVSPNIGTSTLRLPSWED